MKQLCIALGLVALSGCVAVPDNLGSGVYMQSITKSGNISREVAYGSPSNCETSARKNWASFNAEGIDLRCSPKSRANELPVVMEFEGGGDRFTALFHSMEYCTSYRADILRAAESRNMRLITSECEKNKDFILNK